MAEKAKQLKQFGYAANSNLVLQADRSGIQRSSREPSGAPESLYGQIKKNKMGDRITHERPKELEDRLEKMRKRRSNDAGADDTEESELKRARGAQGSVAGMAEQESFYRPKTRETREAYEVILTLIQAQLGDQPQDVLRGAADELLVVLKNDKLRDPERKEQAVELLGPFKDELMAMFVAQGKRITDFSADDEEQDGDEKIDDELGVAVVFDESDSEGSDIDEIREDDDEIGESAGRDAGTAEAALHGMDSDDEEGAGKDQKASSGIVEARSIDAFWMQRQLAQFFHDAHEAQAKATECLEILAEADPRECENRLVILLDYERFDFIKFLLRNRRRILFCVRRARAETDEERAEIEASSQGDPELESVLRELRGEKDKTGGDKRRRRGDSEKSGPVDATSALSVVDLDAIRFDEGGHTMSNRKCVLPDGSYRLQKKGYEEVHVPAAKHRASESEELKAIADMPSWSAPAFKGMDRLNLMQTQTFPCAMESDENMLLCAPTGAGKTNVAMMTIMREAGKNLDEDGNVTDAFKIVYVAPMKSLVQEVVGNLGNRLKPFNMSVRELSGDHNLSRQQMEETHVIVTTPEKWDIITRKSGERSITQHVRLIIIDEIHLLHDERGPVLEAIVSRTLRQMDATQEPIRLVGLSATLPNYEDVAAFLRVNASSGLFHFDGSHRPCPLQQQYIGVTERKALKRFQLMNEITYEKVMDNAGKHQVLVFVHSRKETAATAKFLRDMALERDAIGDLMSEDSASREVLREEAQNASSEDLRDLLPYGFAIHHAGMTREDRQLVEDLFADRHAQVLVSTATLAWGVNLPAHTVIIKGTQIYNPEKGAWVELSPLDIMQMMGRAGRPAHDTFGEGIVITSHQELQYYLSLLNEQLPIESQMITRLADALNAEVVLGTVTTLREAVEWLGYSYLFVRMLRNPHLYGIDPSVLESDPLLEQRRADLAHSAALLLDRHALINYDRKSSALQATDLGRVASHYYVSHSSIATYNEHLRPTMSDIDMFRLFALSEEFKYMVVRHEEKQELQRLAERMPIPVKESVEEATAKVNVLLQAFISRLKLDGFALRADMVYVTQSAGRLSRALHEIVLRRGWAALASRTLALCRMIDQRMWGSMSPLRQFKALPMEIVSRIEKKGYDWERLFDLSPQELGELVRNPRAGKAVYKHVHMLPRLDLTCHVQPITRALLRCELTLQADFKWDDRIHGGAEAFHLVCEDCDGETVLHHELFVLRRRFADAEHYVTFVVPVFEVPQPQYFVRVTSARWLGAETVLPISFRHLILPERHAPPTELLDLQPLPVDALRSEAARRLCEPDAGAGSVFNPIQTQCHAALYGGDENVLVCAPSGAGTTACAAFALSRALEQRAGEEGGARCVYLAPKAALAEARCAAWAPRLRALGLECSVLTGEAAVDLRLLERSAVSCATPEIWDALSRRWRQRRAVREVDLVIADEVHLVGGEGGATYEVVLSRMRYIGVQAAEEASEAGTAARRVRLVALGAPMANARDVAEWLGCARGAVFNFAPAARPAPLEVSLRGFDVSQPSARLLAMAKPAFRAIAATAPRGEPALVYTPGRRAAKVAAVDLVALAAAEAAALGGSSSSSSSSGGDAMDDGGAAAPRFRRGAAEDLAALASQCSDRTLRETLPHGVVFVHGGLSASDRASAERAWRAGAAQVMVTPAEECWGAERAAHCVVVMDTQRFDARENLYIDYPIADVLRMMGAASAPRGGGAAHCAILCYAPKKEYYRRFLYEPVPVESHLDRELHDHVNAEIVASTIESRQDAVDYLTWTLLYRRLTQNPNYYNLTGVTHHHLSDFLSETVERTLGDLEQCGCVAVNDAPAEREGKEAESDEDDEEPELAPLELGMIASYYYIRYTTIELFSSSLTAKTKLRGLLEIVCAATEVDDLVVRPREDAQLLRLARHLPRAAGAPLGLPAGSALAPESFADAHVKAGVLLQCHLSRVPLAGDMRGDQERVIALAVRLVAAAVDVVASRQWLRPALAAMETCQMVVQALWGSDSPLLQLPHVDAKMASEFAGEGVESVYDLVDLEDDARERCLAKLSDAQTSDVARACNRYPNIDVAYEIDGAEEADTSAPITVRVQLEREEDWEPLPVHAPYYPRRKDEQWWLAVGDVDDNALLAIKRLTVGRDARAKLQFVPPRAGKRTYTLFLMSDSYVGCDQEFEFEAKVSEAEDGDSDSDGMQE